MLIELGLSRIDGVGVYAVCLLDVGEKIADGVHEIDYRRIVPWRNVNSCDPEVLRMISRFCIGTPEGFIPPEKFDFNRLSVEWYLNHSCDGNVGFNLDGGFIARRAIPKGEELTYDYGLAESNPRFIMNCKCGSSHCRKVITGDDWKNPEFRERNLQYMLPRLRESGIETRTRAETIGIAARHR